MTRPSILLVVVAMALALAPARLASAFADEAPAPASAHGEAAPAEGHGSGDEQPRILEFKPTLMVATLLVFLVLLAVLWRFAWGPLSEALADRERKQEETIKNAEDARAESARLLTEHKKQMESAAEQVRQMLDDARRQADANAQTIVQAAQQEGEAARERASREIGVAKDQALNEIWSKTADLAVSVAGKVLSKELSPDDHRRLVESAVGELPASANGLGGKRA